MDKLQSVLRGMDILLSKDVSLPVLYSGCFTPGIDINDWCDSAPAPGSPTPSVPPLEADWRSLPADTWHAIHEGFRRCDDPDAGGALLGDWRALPAESWAYLHNRFLPRPEQIASQIRGRAYALRKAELGHLKFVDLIADSFGHHFLALQSEGLALLPYAEWRSWDQLYQSYPRFSKNFLYGKLCDMYANGSKDPRRKSSSFLDLCCLASELWSEAST